MGRSKLGSQVGKDGAQDNCCPCSLCSLPQACRTLDLCCTPKTLSCWTPQTLQSSCWTPQTLQSPCCTPLTLQSSCCTPQTLQSSCCTPQTLQSPCWTSQTLQAPCWTPQTLQSSCCTPQILQAPCCTPQTLKSPCCTPQTLQAPCCTPQTLHLSCCPGCFSQAWKSPRSFSPSMGGWAMFGKTCRQGTSHHGEGFKPLPHFSPCLPHP
uniref:Uncharacterized protein n=1 Tax=Cyanistes caeruleus TaxID=156563 RepID=A0A8C0VMA7_CYACU